MFCTTCGHHNPVDARFCSSCGAPTSQKTPSAESLQARPRRSSSARRWLVGCILGVPVLLAVYSYREALLHRAGVYSDFAYYLYDEDYQGGIAHTGTDGRRLWFCQYDPVLRQLLGCDPCSANDRQRVVAEAKALQKHGNGWRRAEISDAEAVCPPDRELLVDLPDGFEVSCDHQRAVRVIFDSKECEGDKAPEGGTPVVESGSNTTGP